MEYFQLYCPEPPRLHADDMTNPFTIVSRCRVAGHLSVRRLDNPTLAVKNTKRDQFMIWLHTGPVVVIHSELVAAFERHGLTGYRSRSATVHFRDGTVSKDYSQLIVVGWAGVARPESGIRLLEKCPGCGVRRYSGMDNAEELIDWNQWSGEDFFLVWPLPELILVTARVAELLAILKTKSYRLGSLRMYENGNLPPTYQGFTVDRLSRYMPDDVAEKYGKPVGLE
jgi:hypothetical protein